MGDKKKTAIASVIALILLSVLAASMFHEKNKLEISINKSLRQGFSYLGSIKDEKFVYDDEYLKYIYPGESLKCEGCFLTYRKLDAYFDLIFIKQALNEADYREIKSQVEEADSTLRKIMPGWEQGRIYNVVNANISPNKGFALDTYCIFGHIYKNKKMADVVLSSMNNNAWLPETMYRNEDKWRQIADESWCVMLIAETGEDKARTVAAAERKLIQAKEFLADSTKTNAEKAAALIHAVMMLNTLTQYEYLGSENTMDYLLMQDSLFQYSMLPDVASNSLLLANALDVLAKSGYDREKLTVIVKKLTDAQDKSGAWYPYGTQGEKNESKNGQAFTTLRAVIGLNSFLNIDK